MMTTLAWCMRRIRTKAALSLIVLVIQNSLLVVMTRFSRNNVLPEDNYYPSTLILNQEIVKLLVCLVLFSHDEANRDLASARQSTAAVAETFVTITVEDDNSGGRASATPLPIDEKGVPSPAAPSSPGRRNGKPPWTVATPGAPRKDVVSASAGEKTVAEEQEAAAPDAHLLKKNGCKTSSMNSGVSPGSTGRCLLPLPTFVQRLRANILKKDTLLLLLPQTLFTVQNFLIFVGLSNLDAVSFQIWSQTKLLSAALFSVWLLHRRLSWVQWLSLALLTFGVLVTQVSNSSINASGKSNLVSANHQAEEMRGKKHTPLPTTTAAPGADSDVGHGNAILGIAACVLSGLSSSYAGVYFEKVVKTTSPTLAIRNIQLSLFGIPLAFLSMMLLDVLPSWKGQALCQQPVHWNVFFSPPDDWKALPVPPSAAGGSCPVQPFFFWRHYDTWLTWGLVGIHALGGLLVAIVVRYADNIVKGFATGIAMIASGLLSSAIWGYKPSLQFVLGAVIVAASTVIFHKFEVKR